MQGYRYWVATRCTNGGLPRSGLTWHRLSIVNYCEFRCATKYSVCDLLLQVRPTDLMGDGA